MRKFLCRCPKFKKQICFFLCLQNESLISFQPLISDYWLFLLLSLSCRWSWTPDWARRPLVVTCCILELWETTIRCTSCSAARGRRRYFLSTPTRLLLPSRSELLFKLFCQVGFYWFVFNLFSSQSEGETFLRMNELLQHDASVSFHSTGVCLIFLLGRLTTTWLFTGLNWCLCFVSQVNWPLFLARNTSDSLEVLPKSSVLYSTAVVFSRVCPS